VGHPSSIAGRIQRVSRASHGWHVDAGRDEREEKKEEGSLSLSLSLGERRGESAPVDRRRVRARAPGALILFLLRSSPSRDVNDLCN